MGGGKSQTSTQSVSIPPEVLARYNSVNAQAQTAAANPFQPYTGEFVAPVNAQQQAGISATNTAASQAQPYYGAATQQLGQAQGQGQGYLGAATGAAFAGAMPVNPSGLDVNAYMNPYTQNVVGATQAALNQQFGQQNAAQQAQAIKAGAFGGERAGLQNAQLQGQQALTESQAIAPLYQANYNQALAAAQQQQGVGLSAAQANRTALQGLGSQLAGLGQQGFTQGATTAQQLAGLGTGAQTAALQGAQAQTAAGTLQQQTQQAGDTAQYQQYLQQQGYPFQVAQFLAGIAEGTGALSGSTTTTTQPAGFFSDERLKTDVKEIGKTNDGQKIYSYKYKGDDRTQIGLMAQDVEKSHPNAVGLMGGYKTVDYKKATEDAERPARATGGLIPAEFDASSMGGAVTSDMAGEAYARGGYALGGDPSNPYGAAGYVPSAPQFAPHQLMIAPGLRAPPQSGMSTAMQTGKDIQGLYNFGKSGLVGTEATKDSPASAGLVGGQGSLSGKNIFSEAKDWLNKPSTAASGGLIAPREYADGGDVDPYELTSDPLKKTIEEQKVTQLSLPKSNSTPGSSQSGLGQLTLGLGAAKGLYDMGSGVASGLGSLGTGFSSAANAGTLDSVLGSGFSAANIGLADAGASAAAPGIMGSIGSFLGSLGPAGFLLGAKDGGSVPSYASGGRGHFEDGGEAFTDPDKLQNILSSGSKAPNQLPLSYNLDDSTQLRGSGLWSGPYAQYGGGLSVGLGGGHFDVDLSRGQAPNSPAQYRGMAKWSKSFASGGLIPRQAHADGDRVLPLSQDVVDAAPGLVPADGTIDQPTGIPADAEGLVVDQKPAEPKYSPEELSKFGKAAVQHIIGTESGGDPRARAATSSAAGLGQFTDSTAQSVLQRHPEIAQGVEYNPKQKGFAATLPAEVQQAMIAAHAVDQAGILSRQGFEPTPQNIKANWFLGEAGGPAFLKGLQRDPTAPGYLLAGTDQVNKNQNVFFNKDGSPRSAQEVMDKINGGGGGGGGRGPVPPGVMGGTPTPRTDSDGSGLIDKATSSSFLVPALGFLGSMLASQRPTLGGALGEGLLGGTGAYMAQQKQDAQLQAMQPVIAQRNVEALTALSSGLKQYNAMNGTNLTLEQFSKLKPGEIARYAGPAAVAAVSGQQTGATPYSYTPDELSSLVIHHPGGVDIPASADPGYLNAYKAHYASFGDNPYGKSQMAFADKALEQSKQSTLSSAGEVIPTPGVLSSAQQGAIAAEKARGASSFNEEGQKFRGEAPKILYALNELENVATQFRSGADAAAQANFDRIMSMIDPNYKHPELHSGAGANYDTAVKDAMYIGLNQLQGLSPRAPAAELGAIRQTIPNINLEPGAVQNIVAKTKADIGYKQKMYDAFDIDKDLDVSKFQKEFMAANPYEEYAKQVKSSMTPALGTAQQRSQPAIPQSQLVTGKVYKDASGVQKKWNGSGWENP